MAILTCMQIFFAFFSVFMVASHASYRPGDIVPMSKMGQYHSMRTPWHDVIGRHCPIFAVNREVLMPIAKPTGYTGADAHKISFQVGREKYLIPWLLVINRKSTEVPMIEVHLRYSGGDIHGVVAKVVDMPHHCYMAFRVKMYGLGPHQINVIKVYGFMDVVQFPCTSDLLMYLPFADLELHSDIRKQFWDPDHWPKHVLVRYTWDEKSEIDVAGGFYVLFSSGIVLSFILAIYVLQSSHDKLARFVRETVSESTLAGEVAKVE